MFRGLLPPPPTTSSAYQELKKKLDAYVYQPPPIPTLSSEDLVFVLQNHERRIYDLLERHERNRQWLPNPSREKRIDFLERRIDEELACARVHVRRAVLHRLRRLVCCVIIQRSFLKLLYTPRPGQLPKISRSLLDDGMVGVGEFGTTLGNGDPCATSSTPDLHW